MKVVLATPSTAYSRDFAILALWVPQKAGTPTEMIFSCGTLWSCGTLMQGWSCTSFGPMGSCDLNSWCYDGTKHPLLLRNLIWNLKNDWFPKGISFSREVSCYINVWGVKLVPGSIQTPDSKHLLTSLRPARGCGTVLGISDGSLLSEGFGQGRRGKAGGRKSSTLG